MDSLQDAPEGEQQDLLNPQGTNVHQTAAERDARETVTEDQASSRESFGKLYARAKEQDQVGAHITQNMVEDSIPDDPDFAWTEDNWGRITKDIPEDYLDEFYDARSEQEAWTIRGRLMRQYDNEMELSKAGLKGFTARMGASILDPTLLPAVVATEGVALPAILAAKAGRLAKIGYIAASGSVIEGVYMASMEHQAPHLQDWKDIAMAVSVGTALGAGGGLIGTRLTKAQRIMKKENEQLLKSMQDYADDLVDGDIEDLHHAGAMEASGPSAVRDVDNFPVRKRIEGRRKKVLNWLRVDDVGRVLKGDNEISRHWAPIIGENSVGDGGVTVKDHSAALISKTQADRLMGHFRQVSEPEWRRYRRENSIPRSQIADGTARRAFMEEVTRKVRAKEFDATPAGKTARAMADNYKESLRLLKEAGREGFEDIVENEAYINRMWSTESVTRFNREFGDKKTRRFLAAAIRAGNPRIPPEVADKVGSKLFDKLRAADANIDGDASKAINQGLTDDLAELLRRADVEEDVIEDIIGKLDDAENLAGKGRDTNAKRRTLIDENFSMNMNGREVSITELWENNAEALHEMYIRQNMGNMALAKVGIKSEKDWKRMIRDIRGYGDDHQLDRKSIEFDVAMMEHWKKIITGRTTEADPHGAFANVSRAMRDANFARLMGQVGFAQVAEAGVAAGRLGWRNLLVNSPMLATTLRSARKGQFDTGMLREWNQYVGGAGTDALMHVVGYRSDDLGVGLGGGKFGRNLDMSLQWSKKATAHASMFHRINAGLQGITVQGISNKFMKLAKKGVDGLSEKELRQLRDLGLDTADLKVIFAQIADKGIAKKGLLLDNVQEMGLSRWDKSAHGARDKLVYALNRYSAQVIQRNFAGEGIMKLDTTLGKIVGQFRGFMIHAYGKHLLHGLSLNQWENYASYMYSMFFAGMAYTSQTSLNSIGRPDQEKYLRERLSVESIAKASFQRAAFASLIPMAIDTGMFFTANDPVFAYGRSSGLATGAVMGNPTVDLGMKMVGAVRGAVSTATQPGYQFSQQDWRNFSNILPLTNAIGVRNFNAIILGELPKKSQDDESWLP